jgi:DNA invertase Pin-like site-specific DNA recombinase
MHGISLGAQRDRLLQFAEENNLIVVDIYEDEGISARKKYTKRPEMCRMLADVQKGLIDIIIFIKLDRWFRNVADFYEVQQILDKNNVNWIATEEDYDTTTANGRLHLNIKLSIAQDEADRTSERIKFVIAAKKARGEEWSVSHSIGFKIVDKKLVVDNETAPIVRTVFEEYLKNRSYYSLSDILKEKYNYNISVKQIQLMLVNERYRNVIVDEKLFDTVKEMRQFKSMRKPTNYPYLFSSLIICGDCGHHINSDYHFQCGKPYVYYRCRYARDKKYAGVCNNRVRLNEKQIEDWLLNNLVSELENYNLKISKQKKIPEKNTAKIKKKMEKLKDLYLNDLIDRDVYEKDYTALKAELAKIEAINKSIATPVDVDVVKTALEAYQGLTQEHKSQFWKMLIKNLVINSDGSFSVIPF